MKPGKVHLSDFIKEPPKWLRIARPSPKSSTSTVLQSLGVEMLFDLAKCSKNSRCCLGHCQYPWERLNHSSFHSVPDNDQRFTKFLPG